MGGMTERRLGQEDRRLLDGFAECVARLVVDRSHGPRALKKPLLLLLLLSRIEHGAERENRFPFAEVEEELGELIAEFGGKPATNGSHPEQPFYHLKNDARSESGNLWRLKLPAGAEMPRGKPPAMGVMRASVGELDGRLFELFARSGEARARAARILLDEWFPESWREEVRERLALPEWSRAGERRGDAAGADRRRRHGFVDAVLANYRHRCAICGFHALLGRSPFGLDAAHVRWVASDGPDEPENGLALCKFHHWAFDRGVIGVDPGALTVVVSKRFSAQEDASRAWIEAVAGRPLEPARDVPPAREFLEWHREHVFFG